MKNWSGAQKVGEGHYFDNLGQRWFFSRGYALNATGSRVARSVKMWRPEI